MFLEESFPTTLAFGSNGGPQFATDIADALSGVELRTGRWAQDRGMWDAGMRNRTRAQAQEMMSFFLVIAKGKANGFRLKDFGAGEDRGLDEYLGTGNGMQVFFQLVKWYELGDESYSKTIYKPVAGTVRVKLNGTPTTAFTVDTSTGFVVMNSPPANGVLVHASYRCEKPARLDIDWLQCRAIEPGVYSFESLPLCEIRDFQ